MNLPPNVRATKDRHGKLRYRFRKAGLHSRYLRGEPGSPEFDMAYARCLDPDLPPDRKHRQSIATKRARQRSFKPFKGRSVVYFIGAGAGLVKIGTTINLYARMKKLQTGSAAQLKILAVTDGGPDLESAYHQRFSLSRFRGEWFRRTPEINAEINLMRIVEKNAQPSISVGQQKLYLSGNSDV